jgi:hypothetical protein
MSNKHHVRQFLVLIFALMIPTFALWTAISNALALPAIGFSNMILGAWMPDIIDALGVQGSSTVLLTQYGELNGKIVPVSQATEVIGFNVNAGILSYSIPFYTALYFATAGNNKLGEYLTGVFVLYVLLVFGLVCMCLKDLMVQLGTIFIDHPTAMVPPADVIAVMYQLNVLIAPTLGPVLLWAWQSRETPLWQDLLATTRKASET